MSDRLVQKHFQYFFIDQHNNYQANLAILTITTLTQTCLTTSHPVSNLTRLSDHQLIPRVEHDGLRKDGQPDKRMQQTEFAHGKVDPVEAGKQGGSSSGGSSSSSGSSGSENPQGASNLGGDGLRKDGQPDQRMKQNQ